MVKGWSHQRPRSVLGRGCNGNVWYKAKYMEQEPHKEAVLNEAAKQERVMVRKEVVRPDGGTGRIVVPPVEELRRTTWAFLTMAAVRCAVSDTLFFSRILLARTTYVVLTGRGAY